MLPLLMMLPKPCFFMWGAACFMPSMTLRTRVAIAASKRSTSRPSMPPVCAGPPALLNRQSILPNFSTASAISARICSSTVTSVWRKMQAGTELLCQRLALRHAAAGDHDFRAFGDEYFRGPQADAARCARDHRNLAIQPSHGVFPLYRKFWSMPQYSRRAGTRQAAWFHVAPATWNPIVAPGHKGRLSPCCGLILDSLIT